MSSESPDLRRRPLTSSSMSSESPGDSPPRPTILQSLSHRQFLRKVSQARRSGVSLPLTLLASPELNRGLQATDAFGFRRSTAHIDSAGLAMVAGKMRKSAGFHVSDLWSQRLQQDFLKRLRVERAQNAKERQSSLLNYLVENRKTLEKPLEAEFVDKNYLQLIDNKEKRRLVERKAAYKFSYESRSVGISPHVSPLKTDRPLLSDTKEAQSHLRVSRVEGLIEHCNSTLQSFRRSTRVLSLNEVSVKASKVLGREQGGKLDMERPWLQVSPEKKGRIRSVLRNLE